MLPWPTGPLAAGHAGTEMLTVATVIDNFMLSDSLSSLSLSLSLSPSLPPSLSYTLNLSLSLSLSLSRRSLEQPRAYIASLNTGAHRDPKMQGLTIFPDCRRDRLRSAVLPVRVRRRTLGGTPTAGRARNAAPRSWPAGPAVARGLGSGLGPASELAWPPEATWVCAGCAGGLQDISQCSYRRHNDPGGGEPAVDCRPAALGDSESACWGRLVGAGLAGTSAGSRPGRRGIRRGHGAGATAATPGSQIDRMTAAITAQRPSLPG